MFNQVIYSDELRAEKTLSSIPPDPQKIYVKRTIHCQLVMTPLQAKNLAQALTNQVEGYEKQFGKIPTPPKEPRKPTTFIA